MAMVRFAGGLRKLIKGMAEVKIEAEDIAECIEKLEKEYAGVKARVYEENGELAESINIYVNGDNIRSLQGTATSLKEEDAVNFMTAFAAG